jgi:protein ImuB
MQRTGILELTCDMQTETEPHSIAFRLSRPATDQRHLRQLFQLRCEREAWTSGMLSMQLTVDRAGWLAEQQTTLFEDERDQQDRELSSLIERLNSRLGEQAVLRHMLMPEALPEWSWREEPWLTSSTSTSTVVADPLVLHSRPWRLEHVPQPIKVLASFPEGPPQHIWFSSGDERVREWWGPERIETGWWRKTDVLRDYFRIETETGAHYWIFRERKTGAWFLHGRFD